MISEKTLATVINKIMIPDIPARKLHMTRNTDLVQYECRDKGKEKEAPLAWTVRRSRP